MPFLRVQKREEAHVAFQRKNLRRKYHWKLLQHLLRRNLLSLRQVSVKAVYADTHRWAYLEGKMRPPMESSRASWSDKQKKEAFSFGVED